MDCASNVERLKEIAEAKARRAAKAKGEKGTKKGGAKKGGGRRKEPAPEEVPLPAPPPKDP